MNNWKKAILKQSATMREAIDVLNLQSLRIVMIIDNEKRLVGTVTDGDIRRGLVNGMGMDSEVSEFMLENLQE